MRVLLTLALIPPATARHWFSTSTECDERRAAGECVVNPYVMDQQCAGWCAGLPPKRVPLVGVGMTTPD